MIYKYNGKTLRVGRAWTDAQGIQHPSNWRTWDEATFTLRGVTTEASPPSFDNRYYWADGIPKSLDDVNEVDVNGAPLLDEDGLQVVTKGLKTQAIAKSKTTAGGMLSVTDWEVIRASEDVVRGVPMLSRRDLSDATATKRAAIRTAEGTITAAITAALTLAEFIALHEPTVDGQGNVTAQAVVNQWPE